MRLAILGASGHGRVVADSAELSGWQTIVFFDDAWPELTQNGAWGVAGNTAKLMECVDEFDGYVVAIGHNSTRNEKLRMLTEQGSNIVSIVHPSAQISPYAHVEPGTVVFANAVVNAYASVGMGAIINSGAVVEHDCIVGDYVHVSPNAVLAGGVNIGAESWIGANASVRQMVSVGQSSVVGMGAVVTHDVADNMVVAGVPARPLSK